MRPGHQEYKKYRRCGAMITSSATGRRCRQEAIPDTDPPRCERHYMQMKAYMSKFYKTAMRGALREQVSSILEESQLKLDEEVAIARAAAAQVVAMYDAALEADMKEGKQGPATVPAALATMDAMQQVTRVVESAARVEVVRAQVANSMSYAVETMIARLLKCAWEVFGDDCRVAELVDALRADLQVPQQLQAGGGTLLLPSGEELDNSVREMDESVPS